MKVAVFLTTHLTNSVGGGYSYWERFIEAIDKYEFSKDLDLCFVGRKQSTDSALKKPYFKLYPRWFYRAFRLLDRIGVSDFFRNVLGTNVNLCNTLDIKRLKEHQIDLIIYPVPATNETRGFPFISINWDLAHLSTHAFPEFFEGRNHQFRNRWYTLYLQEAISIFVESETGKEELIHHAGFTSEKIHVVPMFPGKVVDLTVSSDEQLAILGKFALAPANYYFYPAQFWPHKNHFNLLRAFRRLIEGTDGNVRLVFTGSDQGNRPYIMKIIEDLRLKERVKILGFVSNEEIWTLYKNSIALVMPTFLGPTNMPLLEAQYIGTPIICSDLKGHREMLLDGALFAHPARPDEWTEAMKKVLNREFRQALADRSTQVKNQSMFTIDNAIKMLEVALQQIVPIRKAFG